MTTFYFYPRPPRGGRPGTKAASRVFARIFLSTPSARRATHQCEESRYLDKISIHALREEGDTWRTSWPQQRQRFLSTPSARRATPLLKSSSFQPDDFYPRPPRGGRRIPGEKLAHHKNISIHALREEGDVSEVKGQAAQGDFYPRPPRGGRPYKMQFSTDKTKRFLSTPSARRATRAQDGFYGTEEISIHALREEGDMFIGNFAVTRFISIHALREEGDYFCVPLSPLRKDFYPRPPRGGRRRFPGSNRTIQPISIHALREEGDSKNRDKISIFKQIIQHSARI